MAFDTLASPASLEKTITALQARNVTVRVVKTKDEALSFLQSSIPSGATLSTGGSKTLEQIGFTEYLKNGAHPWKNLKAAIVAEPDPVKKITLRKQSVLADYFLGSVHAVTEQGEVVAVSGSGSQLPSYIYTSDHVIWVVGTQKIVPTLDDAFRRVREYVFPLEDQRQKDLGKSGSTISKWMIFERETGKNRQVTLVFVEEKLGF